MGWIGGTRVQRPGRRRALAELSEQVGGCRHLLGHRQRRTLWKEYLEDLQNTAGPPFFVPRGRGSTLSTWLTRVRSNASPSTFLNRPRSSPACEPAPLPAREARGRAGRRSLRELAGWPAL
jgi:hypothetical protein